MSINLQPDDIDTIEDGGILDGKEVKLCRCKGGWWFAAHNNKVLTGGSHPAIVKFTISKMYPNFQPSLCKSENFSDASVESHSHFLSDDLRKSGHDIFSIQTGPNIEFQITKNNFKVSSVFGTLANDSLNLAELDFPKEFVEGVSGAATEKALCANAKKINIYGR